jgi:lysophospholipase
MQRYPELIKTAVLSSPMIAINSGSIPAWLTKSFIYSGSFINQLFAEQAWYFIGQQDYQASAFTDNPLTHSVSRHQHFLALYQEQPELQLGGVTIQWLKQAIEAQQNIFKQIDQIKTPVLVLQAGADSIVDNLAQNEFCQQLAKQDKPSCIDGKPLVIKGAKHELFFEQDSMRNQALSATVSWFKQHN